MSDVKKSPSDLTQFVDAVYDTDEMEINELKKDLEGSGINIDGMIANVKQMISNAEKSSKRSWITTAADTEMDDLTYEQTVELERNVKIKKQAEELYRKFIENVTLDVKQFRDGRFKIWSDSHNATYLKPNEKGFVYQCRFLHETYNVEVNVSCLFQYIKNDYRGLDHFKSFVEDQATKRKNQ